MAIAAGEAEVWSIEGRDFRAQLEARPALAVDVVRAYAERTRALRKRVRSGSPRRCPPASPTPCSP